MTLVTVRLSHLPVTSRLSGPGTQAAVPSVRFRLSDGGIIVIAILPWSDTDLSQTLEVFFVCVITGNVNARVAPRGAANF
jgi:hypothetical protein